MSTESLKKKYEAVATAVELRHLTADAKRLDALNGNRLVAEHAELAASVPETIADLDEKLEAYEALMAEKREAAKKAATEGDALASDSQKKPAPKAKAKKKAATKKATK